MAIRRDGMLRSGLLVLAVASSFHAAESAEQAGLAGQALRHAIAGRTVFLSTPIGSLPIQYRSNGTMAGTVSVLLSNYTGSKQDRGRWWIAGDRLCQRWSKWLGGKSYCYTMRKVGNTKVHWNRNDGKSGIATISH